MLQEDEIKYVFNEPILQEGDILLMNTYHEGQREKMKGCHYDHAAIYAGDAFIVEADGLGVTQSHIYSYGFKEKDHACVLRLKTSNLKQKKAIVLRAREEMGKAFGVREAYAVNDYKDNPEQEALANKTFCSRLVAVSYLSQGIKIAPNPNYCEPDSFLSSELLVQVIDPLQKATDEIMPTVIQRQNERENPSIVLQEAFSCFGKLYGSSIQTMADLLIAVAGHPELDDKATQVLHEDLRLFDINSEIKQLWPWFDDDDAFKAHFNSIDDRLFFITSQFLHFDKTYLPLFARNVYTVCAYCLYYPHSKMLASIRDGFKAVYEEAVRIRKRLTDLYVDTFSDDEHAFDSFAKRYGFYSGFEYQEVVTDISFILEAMMKHGFPPQNN